MSSKIGGVDGNSPAPPSVPAVPCSVRRMRPPAEPRLPMARVAARSVQITGTARQLASLEQAVRDLPAVNNAKVAQISAAIEQGTYTVDAQAHRRPAHPDGEGPRASCRMAQDPARKRIRNATQMSQIVDASTMDPDVCREHLAEVLAEEAGLLAELRRVFSSASTKCSAAKDAVALEKTILARQERDGCAGPHSRSSVAPFAACMVTPPDYAGLEGLMVWCDRRGRWSRACANAPSVPRDCRDLNDRNGTWWPRS